MRRIETMARRISTIGVLAFAGLVAACGGRIGQNDSPMPSTAPQPIDAGTLIEDAGTPQIYPPAPPDAASSTPDAATCGPSVAACFACTRTPGCDIQPIGAQCSGWLFYRLEDFLAFDVFLPRDGVGDQQQFRASDGGIHDGLCYCLGFFR